MRRRFMHWNPDPDLRVGLLVSLSFFVVLVHTVMSFDARAEALFAEAEKTAKSSSGLFSGFLGPSTDKLEDAAEKFGRAGNAFKAGKKWAEAAKSYRRAAECFNKAKSESEAATSYIECARCYIKAGDGKSGTEILETEALPRIVDSGRLSQAAKLHGEVAEMFEADGQYEEAIKHFQQAADFHNAENAASTAMKSLSKIANLSAQLDPPNWAQATEMFERVGTDSLNSNLLKFGAKSAFFNAVICTVASGDIVAAERALAKYKDLDYTFPSCREAKLADDIVAAFKDMNAEAFTDAIFNYDQISPLDPWRTSVLLKIKTKMQQSGAGGGEGDGSVDLT